MTVQFQQTSFVVPESVGTVTLDVTASGRFEGIIMLELSPIDMEASGILYMYTYLCILHQRVSRLDLYACIDDADTPIA